MGTVVRLIRKVQRNTQDYDWKVAAKRSLAGVLVPVFERRVYRIYRIDLDQATEAAGTENTTGQLTFKLLGRAQRDQLKQIEQYAEWLRGELDGKVASGAVCLAALDGQTVAGFNLVSFGEVYIPPLRRSRVFHDGQAWSEHIAVFPAYRKRGLATEIRRRMIEHLRQRGTRRLYGGTYRWNVPALKLARRLGFRELADGHYRRVLTFKFWSWTRVGYGRA